MKIKDAQQVLREAVKWFPEDSAGRIILKSFELDEYYGEVFAAPVPFGNFTEQEEWTQSKDSGSVTAQIRRMQESMDTREFPLHSSLYLTHEKGYCFLILGTDQVDVIRERREQGGLANVTLSFKGEGKTDELPRFGKGDLVQVAASTPTKGWLYLFSVDADRVITSIYPGEGQVSDIALSQNTRIDITEKLNEAMRKEARRQNKEYMPLRYCGDTAGLERVIAMVVEGDDPVPVTIAHLRSRFSLPFLFAHEQRHKGMGFGSIDSENDFASHPLDKIAIGTLDYYYEG